MMFVLVFITPNPTRLWSDLAPLSVPLLDYYEQYFDTVVFDLAMKDASIILGKTQTQRQKTKAGARGGREKDGIYGNR